MRARIIVLLCTIAGLLPIATAQAGDNGWVSGFHVAGIFGRVDCVIDYQGDLVAAGQFRAATDVLTRNIARWDGTNWHPLGEGIAYGVACATVHGTSLVVASTPSPSGVVSIREWDGDSWRDLGEANESVLVLLSWEDRLYAAGSFSSLDGVLASRLGCRDSAGWSAVGGGADNTVRALAIYDGSLIAGGDFTRAGNSAAAHVASWNGGTWSAMGEGLDGPVYDLTEYGGDLVAAGIIYGSFGGLAHPVVAWDGTMWRSLNAPVFGDGRRLAVQGGRLFASFHEEPFYAYANTENSIRVWDGATWVTVYSAPYLNVNDMCEWAGGLVVGNGQDAMGGQAVSGVALYREGAWAPLGAAGLGIGGPVNALAMSGSDVVAGGFFKVAGAVVSYGGVALDASGWRSILAPPYARGPVSVAGFGLTRVIFGGGTSTICTETTPCCAFAWISADNPLHPHGWARAVRSLIAFEGSVWFGVENCGDVPLVCRGGLWPEDGVGSGWSGGHVSAFTVFRNELVAGGSFSEVDGQSAASLAIWRDGVWVPVPEAPGAEVAALAAFSDELIVAGAFQEVGGGDRQGIYAWNGSTWRSLGLVQSSGSYSACIKALAHFDGSLVAGGAFDVIDGQLVSNLARWDGTCWEPLGQGVNGDVRALAVTGSRLYVGGSFSLAGGKPSANIACWDESLVPVQLTGLSATRVGTRALLHWGLTTSAATAGFHVWRDEDGHARRCLTSVPLLGSADFEFTDPAPPPGEADYWLEELAADGGTSLWHGPAHLPAAPVPAAVRLDQNRPNPFNPRTTLTLALPQAGRVSLAVYDARGRRVATLLDGELPAGEREVVWDGRDGAGRSLPSGEYLARLTAPGGTRTVKLTLAR